MNAEWAGIIVTFVLGATGVLIGLRKQPSEIRTNNSTALKSSMEVNNMLTEQMEKLQKRIDVLERTTKGPFRLTVEFSTGETPKVHKAEIIAIELK